MSLETDLLGSREEIEPLIAAWRAVAERGGNPFSSPEWFDSTSSATETGWHPAVIVVRRDGALIGVAPFVRRRSNRKWELRFAGSELADLMQPAAAPADAPQVATATAAALAQLKPSPISLSLGRVQSDATWWQELRQGLPVVATVGPPDQLPYAELPHSWEEYLASRSRSFRSQMGRKMRALRREHDVTVRLSSERVDVERDLETLFHLHDLRWREREDADAFGATTRELHRRFALATADAGWARLLIMEVDGAPAAAWYGWKLGKRMLYYQAGFDPSWQRHSIGFLLLGETFRNAIEEGCETYDMLLGDEAFKARFADSSREGVRVTLTRPLSMASIVARGNGLAQRAWRQLPDEATAKLNRFRR